MSEEQKGSTKLSFKRSKQALFWSRCTQNLNCPKRTRSG
jgi:hypothetical protein